MNLDKRKEKDLAVRSRLQSEIDKSKENLKNIMEEVFGESDSDASTAVQKAMDELDTLANDVDMSSVGHKYPWFSQQRSIDNKQAQKVIGQDAKVVKSVENVTKASRIISDGLIDSKGLDVSKEMKKLRQYITDTRNEYQKRIDFIKGLK